jgi:low temperature requirement protein LtrA
MPSEAAPSNRGGDDAHVSSLELFFDLVFVFVITQLTSILTEARWVSAGRVALLLVIIWWMYGAYAWLTNVLTPDRVTYQVLLVGGMSAFFVLAITVPRAFDSTGSVFGAAYLVIVLLHAAMFTRSRRGANARAILTIAPWNIVVAVLLIVAGQVHGPWRWALWIVAAAIILLPSLRPIDQRFEIAPAHFVERHGLIVIIALGESVVAIGVASSDHPITVERTVVAVLGLALTACLWWMYFGRDNEEHALQAMRRAPMERQAALALRAFYHCELLMLGGIVGSAAALRHVVDHPAGELTTGQAVTFAAGVAVYLAGIAAFRAVLGLGHLVWPSAAAALALASIPAGASVSASTQLACLAGTTFACLLAGERPAQSEATLR